MSLSRALIQAYREKVGASPDAAAMAVIDAIVADSRHKNWDMDLQVWAKVIGAAVPARPPLRAVGEARKAQTGKRMASPRPPSR